ncbi:MAG: hypothetical protein EOO39_14545, partial [Cytophagaceae bacterium]
MKSNSFFATAIIGILFVSSSCQQDTVEAQPALYQSNFEQSADGWVADLVDYSEQTGDIQFTSSQTGLPQPLNGNRQSLMLSSINRSDDVFMYLTKKLTGLQPNRTYQLVFDVELASVYGTDSFGIGGSPGSSVYIKAGATAFEPKRVLTEGFYALNIDKGNQSMGGRDAVVLGTIGVGEDVTDYTLITRSNMQAPFVVRTNEQGELWLVVGTDSGYEGETKLYYSSIR